MEFFYTSIPRTYESGILQIGHAVTPLMIIPPGTTEYVVLGDCNSECTSNVCVEMLSKLTVYLLFNYRVLLFTIEPGRRTILVYRTRSERVMPPHSPNSASSLVPILFP